MEFDWFLFLVLLQRPVFGHLTVTPRNQVTSAGSRVTFHCQTNITKRITWSHTPVGRKLSRDNLNRAGYTISSNDSRNYHFTIESVTPEDAGVHAWSDNDGFGPSFGIDLVVIHAGLSCVTNVTADGVTAGDTILIVCSVAYSGNMKYTGKWIDSGGTLITHSEDHLSSTSDEKVFSRLVTINATQDRRQVYRFLLTFSARDKTRDPRRFAVNDPDEIYTWTSSEVNVQFPASNIQVNDTKEDGLVLMYLGETVTCSSEGNPEVQFHWEEFDVRSGRGKNISTGPHLTLSASGRHIYRCIAENIIRNELHRLISKNISVDVLPRTESHSSQSIYSQTDDAMTRSITSVSAGLSKSFAAESSENGGAWLSVHPVTHQLSSETDAATERIKLLNETTLFFLTLVLSSILIAAIAASVTCLVISKTRKRRLRIRLASEEHYLTVDASGKEKLADKSSYNGEPACGYAEYRKSDIYEEINESEVIDDFLPRPRVHEEAKGYWKMPLNSSLRHKNSTDGEIITMESSYITCPATLLASDIVTISCFTE